MDGIHEPERFQWNAGSVVITLAFAILRSFIRDRPTLFMAVCAPAIFFALFALFYQHLDSPQGFHFSIAIVGNSGRDADAFKESLMRRNDERLKIICFNTRDDLNAAPNPAVDAFIYICDDFTRQKPVVEIVSISPLPGMSNALRVLVLSAAAEAIAVKNSEVTIHDRTIQGRLLRSSASAIPVLFVLFAMAALVSRGLADEEMGVGDRMCSLGVSRRRQTAARIAALSIIGFVQMLITLFVATMLFNIIPLAPLWIAMAMMLGAIAIATFMVTLAGLCRSRARFATIAPVATLVLGALGGGIVPLELLPPSFSWLSNWVFTGWTTIACARAMDGGAAMTQILLLIAINCVMLFIASTLSWRTTS